jgi:hypothetical protein
MGRQHGSNHWIKVQKHTPDKPELRHVSRVCGVTLGDAFLAWFRVYAYFDESTDDGTLALFTSEDVDDLGKLPGLGAALASVGWLLFDARGCTVVHWHRHNYFQQSRNSISARSWWWRFSRASRLWTKLWLWRRRRRWRPQQRRRIFYCCFANNRYRCWGSTKRQQLSTRTECRV